LQHIGPARSMAHRPPDRHRRPPVRGNNVRPHPLPFRTRGDGGNGASGCGQGTIGSPRLSGGGRRRFGRRGARIDHRWLRPCGAAMGACAAQGKTGASQGEEIGGEGGAKAGEARAETSVSPMPRTRWGPGSVSPADPYKFRSRGAGWQHPQIFFASSAEMVFLFGAIFRPEPAYRRLFCGSGRDWGVC
jgi:hypothetical protein